MKTCFLCSKQMNDKITDGICPACRSQQKAEEEDFKIFNRKPCSRSEIEQIRFSDHALRLFLSGFIAALFFCSSVWTVMYFGASSTVSHSDAASRAQSRGASGIAVVIVGAISLVLVEYIFRLFKPKECEVIFQKHTQSMFLGGFIGLVPGLFAGIACGDVVPREFKMFVVPLLCAFVMALCGFGMALRSDKKDKESALKNFDKWEKSNNISGA